MIISDGHSVGWVMHIVVIMLFKADALVRWAGTMGDANRYFMTPFQGWAWRIDSDGTHHCCITPFQHQGGDAFYSLSL